MNKKKPLILVCNDDGIHAPGITALIEVVSKFAEVIIVAPDKPRSGSGMAITINSVLRAPKVQIVNNMEGYACNGTPVDCVKLAMNKLVSRRPNLIVSGINHGANYSINVIYSGTMSAAIEGALENIPAIGFSLLDHSIEADFSASKIYVEQIVKQVLKTGLPSHTCLNVNIPKLPSGEIQGVRVCRQANANWHEDFDKRTDPMGGEYYWLTGKFKNYDDGKDTDLWALENNYVSVVPVQYDLTNHKALKSLKKLES